MSESTLKPFSGKLDNNTDQKQQPALKPFTGALDGEEKGVMGQAKDHAIAFAGKGAVGGGQILVGLSDLMSDGATGKILSEKFGYDPKATNQEMTTWQTPQLQEQIKQKAQLPIQKIDENDDLSTKAGKLFDNTKEYLKFYKDNPAMITNSVAESLIPMGVGAALGRGTGIANPVAAGAVGEGLGMAGSQAESIRQETVDGRLTADQSLAGATTGVLGGLIGFAGGRLAQKMGIGDVDTMLVSGRAGPAEIAGEIASMPAKSLPRRVIEGAISEGFLEELPQSVSEQILQNLALDKPWSDGVEDAAVMGTLAGMAMGGAANILSGHNTDTESQDNQQPPSTPNLPSAPPQLGSSPDNALTGEYIPRENVPQGDNQGRTAFVYDQPSMGADNLLNNNGANDADSFSASSGFDSPNNPDSPLSPKGGNYFNNSSTQPQLPSERLGINPNDGPLSSAAALAVDSGASPIAQLGYTPEQQTQEQSNTPLSDAVPSNYQSLLGSQNDGQPFNANLEDATAQQGNTQADMGGAIETDTAQTTTAQTVQPILGQDGKNKWFGTQEKAQAFIDKKDLGNDYQVVQDGKRFEIQPKAKSPVQDDAYFQSQLDQLDKQRAAFEAVGDDVNATNLYGEMQKVSREWQIASAKNQPGTNQTPKKEYQETESDKAWAEHYRTNRNMIGDDLFEGGHNDRNELENSPKDVQSRSAHGMAKSTPASAVADLKKLLNDGIDPNRGGGRLFTAPLNNVVANEEERRAASMSGTSSGSSYGDGAFTLVAKQGIGDIRNISEVEAVMVNSSVPKAVVDGLRQDFPNMKFGYAKELPSLLSGVKQSNNAQTQVAELEQQLKNEKSVSKKSKIRKQITELQNGLTEQAQGDVPPNNELQNADIKNLADSTQETTPPNAAPNIEDLVSVTTNDGETHMVLASELNDSNVKNLTKFSAQGKRVAVKLPRGRIASTSEQNKQPQQNEAPAAQPVSATGKNSDNKFQKYDDVAKQYGRSVNSDGAILSNKGKVTGVRIKELKGRVRIEQADGKLLHSGPNPESLGKFLEDYWYDKKIEPKQEANNQQVNEAPKAEQTKVEATQTEATQKPKAEASENRLVSDDRAAELRARLKAKLSQLNSGIDPEILAIGTELAVYHIERGARKFSAFAKNIANDLGVSVDKIRPYLRSWYNGARDMMEDMGADIQGMDSADTVRAELAKLDNSQQSDGEVSQTESHLQENEVTHIEGKKSEKATNSVVEESLDKAEGNLTKAQYDKMRNELIADIEQAIAIAPNDSTEQITFDVKGDGKFKVHNNKAALSKFLKQVKANSGFKAPSKAKKSNVVSSGSFNAISSIKAMLTDNVDEYSIFNAYQIAQNADVQTIFVQDQGKVEPYFVVEQVAEVESNPLYLVLCKEKQGASFVVVSQHGGRLGDSASFANKAKENGLSKINIKGQELILKALRGERERLKGFTQENLKAQFEQKMAEVFAVDMESSSSAIQNEDGIERIQDKRSDSKESIQDLGEKIGGARKDTALSTGKSKKTKSNDDRPTWAKRYSISEIVSSTNSNESGKWVIEDSKKTDWKGSPKKLGMFDSEQEAQDMLPVIAVSLKHRVYARRTSEGGFEIWRQINDSKRVKIVNQVFETKEAAQTYLIKNAIDILETNTNFGELDLPRPEITVRQGIERRKGDAKDTDFMDVFGFRGVEFGNWNNQEERQQLLNDAYDGLFDLADVLKIPAKAISLNGDLALAFGARGQGLSSARAHYEPAKVVINLTKMNGAGTLAHEWWHAFDHYLARQDGMASADWILDADGTRSLKVSNNSKDQMVSHGFSRRNSGVREDVREVYKALMQTMTTKAEQYVQDTATVDDFVGRSKNEITQKLESIRQDLSRQLDPKYYKRHNKPASAEQLAEFDTLAQQIVNGEHLETEARYDEAKRSSRNVFAGARWTNDALDKISAIYKAVRGRSGFNSEQKGTLDRLRQSMSSYASRLKMLADAQKGEAKTKKVPTEFAMDAKRLDEGRASDYWTTPHEMSARAFQGFVEDKIAAQAGKSPFLNYAPENKGVNTPWGWVRPYPHGSERKAINEKFDVLVDTLKTEETDTGIRLFSRNKLKPDSERSGTSPMDSTFKPLSVVGATRRAVDFLNKFKLSTTVDAAASGNIRVSLDSGVNEVGNMDGDGFTVQVVADFDGLPAAIQQDATYTDENGDSQNYEVSGVWHNRTLYVVADAVQGDSAKQLTTFDAYEELLAHEIVGHFGVQRLFGDEYKTKLQALFNSLGGLKGIRKIAKDNGVDVQQFESAYIQPRLQAAKDGIYTEADVQQSLVGELFAFVEQNAKTKPFVRQKLKEVIGYVRQWLREHGFAKFLAKHNDADVMMFLAEARKGLLNPTAKIKYSKAQFGRNGDNVPLFSRKTSTETAEVAQVRKQFENTPQWMKAPNGNPTNLTERQWLQVRTPNFKKWFGDWENDPANASKVIDENGEPQVRNHGTRDNWTQWDKERAGGLIHTTDDMNIADRYAQGAGGGRKRSEPVYQDNDGNIYELDGNDYVNRQDGSRLSSRDIQDMIDYGDINPVYPDARIKPIYVRAENPLDLNTDRGLKVLAGIQASSRFGQGVVNQAKDGYFDWNSTKHEFKNKHWANDLVPKLKALGYDAITFADDGHQTLSVFDSEKIKSATDNVGTFDSNNPDIRFSRKSGNQKTGQTIQQVRDVLIDRFGKDVIEELERQGKLEIIQDYDVDGAEGFYKNGKAVLVASNLTAESTVPTFLHELGGHAGFQNMMTDAQYNELMKQFDKLVEQGNPVAIAAKELAEREQGLERQQLEYLPYLLTLASTMQQKNVLQRNALQRLIRNLVSHVKAWLFDKFGINLNLNPDDMVALAERMIDKAASNAIGNTGTFNSENADIRFSRVDLSGSINRLSKSFKQASAQSTNQWLKNKAKDTLGIALQALTRRQIMDVYGKLLPQLHRYNHIVELMDADATETSVNADNIVNDWGKLKDEQQLAELMHEATLAKIDPAKPFVSGSGTSISKYAQLLKAYNALTPEAQAMYVKARDAYSKHYADVHQAIKERILRSELSNQKKTDLLKQMDDNFFAQSKGVYFPLSRFGKYVVVVRDANGVVESVNRAETLNEAEAVRIELQKQFPNSDVSTVTKDKEFNASRDGVGRGFMSELFKEAGNLGLSAKDQADFEDTLSQLYLASMPDLSWAKHGIHRKGMAGFSQNARRAFAQNMFHGGSYLAKLRYGDQLAEQLDSMKKAVEKEIDTNPDYDQVTARNVYEEMEKRHENYMNPKPHPVYTALTSAGFVYYLGLSPAAAMVNLSQTALVAYPLMGAKFGFKKSAAALKAAMADFAKGVDVKNRNLDITKSLNTDEKKAYEEALRRGVIDKTQVHSLAGVAQGEDSGLSEKLKPIMKWSSFMFHHAERFNREVTFVAAYRLAKEHSIVENGKPRKLTNDEALEMAIDMTYKGHFDYSAGNRARFMQGNVAKVVLLFKQFAQNMIFTLMRQAYLSMYGMDVNERKEARKALTAILAFHGMAAGLLGLPIATSLVAASFLIAKKNPMLGMLFGAGAAAVFFGAGGDDDDPWDLEVEIRNYAAEVLGDDAANYLFKGAPRALGIDLSGRVGLDNLVIPKVQDGLEGQNLSNSIMAGALGPVAGIGANLFKGGQELGDGNLGLAMEAMLPVVMKNPIKAARYFNDGVQDKTGISIQDEVDAWGVFNQTIGFSPADVRLAYEGRSAIYQKQNRLKDRRGELMSMWSRARKQDDQEEMDAIWEEIQAFNEINPKIRINRMQLMQSYRQRENRVNKSEDGIYVTRKYEDSREAGAFAFGE